MVAEIRKSEASFKPDPSRKEVMVGMLIQAFWPRVGGAERQLQSLLPRFRARGVKVAVLTRRYKGLHARAILAGSPVYRMPIPGGRGLASVSYTLSCIWLLARSRSRFDLLHAYELLSPTTTAVLAKLLFRFPIVVKLLNGGPTGDVALLKSGTLGRLRWWVFIRLVDVFIAISHQIEDELCAAGVPKSRVAKIPNGVDTDYFCPVSPTERETLRVRLELPLAPAILFVGRLEPAKGLDYLLRAWPIVRETFPDALLVIAGDGSMRAGLESQRVPNVRFVGMLEKPRRYFQAADAFVLPSLAEGLSNALLEAMSTGLPCVATRVGGSLDVIEHGSTGMLVPPGRPAELAGALIRILDCQARDAIGAAARSRMIRDYSLDSTADRLTELYRRLAVRRT